MKFIMLAISVGVIWVSSTPAQPWKIAQRIRRLEQQQVEYLLRGNIEAMERNWSTDYTVNNPFHKIVNAHRGPIYARTLTYSRFERDVERVLVHSRTVIVMGSETVVPKDQSPDAGKTINRRFTNVWMYERGKWLLVARQASVICPK